jgi:hypothetical protein
MRTTHLRTGVRSGAGRHRIAGLTLVECLVYTSCVLVLLGAGGTAFHAAIASSAKLRQNADDIVHALKAGERWRADLRKATGPPALEQGLASRALAIPHKDGRITYLVVSNTVLRCTEPGDRCEVVFAAVKTSDFVRDPRQHVAAWRWELELPSRLKTARVRPLFTFTAVPPEGGAR